MLALLAAVIQHTRILQRLDHPDFAYDGVPIAATVAIMLLMIGAFGLVGVVL
jgi:hypothetical protein